MYSMVVSCQQRSLFYTINDFSHTNSTCLFDLTFNQHFLLSKGYEYVNKNRKSVFNTLSAPSFKMKINRQVLQVQRPSAIIITNLNERFISSGNWRPTFGRLLKTRPKLFPPSRSRYRY